MMYSDLNEEETDKYDSAFVAILKNISIIHSLGLEKQLLTDLLSAVPEQVQSLVSCAKEMKIGDYDLRKSSW